MGYPGDRAAAEEIFGLVAVVLPFVDEAETVQLANATIYGLSGSLWTHDLARGLRVAQGDRDRHPCRSTHLGAGGDRS